MTTRSLVASGILLGVMICALMGQDHDSIIRSIPDTQEMQASLKSSRATMNSIQHALGKPYRANFIDVSLSDVIEKISEDRQINIWPDLKAMSDEGISIDQTVTLKMQTANLREVLRLMLEPLSLTYVIEDGVLKITTQTAADEKLTTRVYPVRDLTMSQSNGVSIDDLNLLITAIQSSTPGKWEEVVGEGGMLCAIPNASSLVIRQTQRDHERIEGLLTALRKAKNQPRIPSIPTDPNDIDEMAVELPAARKSGTSSKSRTGSKKSSQTAPSR